MKNFIQVGDIIDYTNASTAIAAGAVVVIGNRIGVAVTDIPSGATGALRVRGVVELKSVSGEIAQGAQVYWHTSNGITTSSDGGAALAGFATEKSASTVLTCRVSLNA